jgi:tetratricopeptide (TPR) repeat protein
MPLASHDDFPSANSRNVTIANSPVCGKALQAARRFLPGEAIICEQPLFCIREEFDHSGASDGVERSLAPHVLAMKEVCSTTPEVQDHVDEMYYPNLSGASELISQCREAADFVLQHPKAFPWAKGKSAERLQRFALAFHVNAHQFEGSDRALFRFGGQLRHSCAPNTRFSSASGVGRHFATEHIEPGDWLTTNHLGPWIILPTHLRRERLLATKLMSCDCPRCKGPDFSRQIPCPICHPRDPREPVLGKEVGLETRTVNYAVWTPSLDDKDCSAASTLPQEVPGAWSCAACGYNCADDGLGFDPKFEARLESGVLELEQQWDEDLSLTYDDVMQWFIAVIKILGRRHWLAAKAALIACDVLEAQLLISDSLKAEQVDYYGDELLSHLTLLWHWFTTARCSPMLHHAPFISGCNTLLRLPITRVPLQPLGLHCAWFYPWIQLLKGTDGAETNAARKILRSLRGIRAASESAVSEALRDAFKARGNELFAQATDDETRCREAILWYSQAMLVCPDDATLYSNRSAAHLLLQCPSDAAADARRCVALNPDWPKGYFRLATALKAQHRRAEALEVVQRLLALAPGDDTVTQLAKQIRKMKS